MSSPARLTVSIDPLECGCTGYCVRLVPEAFQLADDGPTVVRDPHPPAGLLDRLLEAETLCPTHAITVQADPDA